MFMGVAELVDTSAARGRFLTIAVYRVQISLGADSPLPRDRIVMAPHFVGTAPANWTAEMDSLCTALVSWMGSPVREVRATAYVADKTPPNLPLGSSFTQKDSFPVSAAPRELAVCLSYYSGVNIPRRRGRLYVPALLLGGGGATVRPSAAVMAKSKNLGPILHNVGGTSLEWAVYSRIDDAAFPVTNWYADDEWDVMRSRGLRPTTRDAAST